MADFPIDPELRIRASRPIVLRRTTEAIEFIRKTTLSSPNRAWEAVLQSLEAAQDEWTAMEAVVSTGQSGSANCSLKANQSAKSVRSPISRISRRFIGGLQRLSGTLANFCAPGAPAARQEWTAEERP